MNVQLAYLVYDRPDALLASIPSALAAKTAGARLTVHVDAGDYDILHLSHQVTDPADVWISSPERAGVAGSLNRLLALRKPEEHFCWLSSDTVIEGEDWLPRLLEGLGAYQIVAPAPQKVPRDEARYAASICPASGAVLFDAAVMTSLGGFRAYGKYGCTDLDFYTRAHHAGYRMAYDTHVRSSTEPFNPSRQQDVESALKEFKRNEVLYQRQEQIFQPIGGGDD